MNEILPVSRESALAGHNALPEQTEAWLQALDCSPNTKATYRNNLKAFFAWLSDYPQPVNETAVMAFREFLSREKGLKPRTVRNYVQTVTLFLDWLAQDHPELAGTMQRIRRIRKPKIGRDFSHKALTLEEIDALFASIRGNSLQAARKRALFALLLCTGLRISAVCQADLCDFKRIDGQRVLIYLCKGYESKTDDVYVKIPPQVWGLIEIYLDKRFKGADWVMTEPLFTSTSPNSMGKRMSTRSLSGIIKEQLRAIGLDEGYCAHGFRNTFAQNTILLGTKVHEVQAILNHSDISTTSIYMKGIERRKNSGEQRMAEAIFGNQD